MDEVRRNRAKQGILWFGPVLLLWGLVILPSTFHSVWGSLDDGFILSNARNGFAAAFNTHAGRMNPVYWLHNWLLYMLGGTDPTVWYTIQSLEFLLATLLTYAAVGSLTHHWPSAALAAAVLLTSSPISENAYTLAKNEPRVVLLLTLIALILTSILRRTLYENSGPSGRFVTGTLWLVLTLAILMVVFAKESAIALTALGPAGAFLSRLYLRGSRQTLAVKTFLWVSALLFGASALLLGLRLTMLTRAEHAYTTYSASVGLSLSNLEFYVSQAPDILIMAVACATFGAIQSVVTWRVHTGGHTHGESDIQTVMGFAYLITGAAYWLLLLLWRWPMNYYMLPVAVCVSLSLGFLIANSRFQKLRIGPPAGVRTYVTVLAVVICATRFYSIPYLHFVATAQRAFDVIEDEVSSEVVRIKPMHRRLIDIERASFVEQPLQRNLLYAISGNPDVSWVGGGELLQEYPEPMRRLYGSNKRAAVQDDPPRGGDLFLIQASAYPFNIPLRGVGPHGTPLALSAKKVEMLQERIGLSLSDVRKWQTELNVYKPWTLQRAKLVFRSIVYQTSTQPRYQSSRLPTTPDGLR